jgi:hypothetical protein
MGILRFSICDVVQPTSNLTIAVPKPQAFCWCGSLEVDESALWAASDFGDAIVQVKVHEAHARELSLLEKLSRKVALCFDVESAFSLFCLFDDGWRERTLQLVKAFGVKTAARIPIDPSIPIETIVPWLARFAIELGPFRLFIDCPKSVEVIQKTQRFLLDHPGAHGAAHLVPIFRSKPLEVGSHRFQLFDLADLDTMLVELGKPFCKEICFGQASETFLDISAEKLFQRMVLEHSLSNAVLEKLGKGAYLPLLFRLIYLQFGGFPETPIHKKRVQMARDDLEEALADSPSFSKERVRKVLDELDKQVRPSFRMVSAVAGREE